MNSNRTTSDMTTATALAALLLTPVLWLGLILPSLADTTEPFAVQEKVDRFLGAVGKPGPAAVRLPLPDAVRPPFAGQPYDQQPAAAQNDFRAPVGGPFVTPSDARLKREVRHLATLENGHEVYAFKYLWDDTVHVGVMAQDLLAREDFKAAVIAMPNGYYAVDYAMLGLKMITLEAWHESPRALFTSGQAGSMSAQPH